jgi:putative flavoprotein involved in K+ transport
LSTSYHLTKQNREHVILEKDRIGESWKSKKWDSFTLVTPNWQLRLPGFAYDGNDPDGFLTRDEVAEYVDDYASQFNPPIRLGVEASSVEKGNNGDGFRVETNAGELEADNVVVATGTFQKPSIPDFSLRISPDVVQMHSSRYRNPEVLPPGAVLVVGGGQSGCQIAEELYQSGRKVYLCTSNTRRAPRRYRGKDFTWWLDKMGVIDDTVDDLDSPEERFDPNPYVTGKNGGYTLNLHRFARDGVTLLGGLKDAEGPKVKMAGNLKENLTRADKFAAQLKKGVDKFIKKTSMDAPEEDQPELRAGYEAERITDLDLKAAGIKTIIWATGYDFNYNWVKFPIWDEFGYPVQERGVTQVPGLYFAGLHWMYTLKSGLFIGVGEDTAHVVEHIEAR